MPKTIDIKLRTLADTSGTDQVRQSISGYTYARFHSDTSKWPKGFLRLWIEPIE
jgi:hypothetical protein